MFNDIISKKKENNIDPCKKIMNRYTKYFLMLSEVEFKDSSFEQFWKKYKY